LTAKYFAEEDRNGKRIIHEKYAVKKYESAKASPHEFKTAPEKLNMGQPV
jgi:hypothetical protein